MEASVFEGVSQQVCVCACTGSRWNACIWVKRMWQINDVFLWPEGCTVVFLSVSVYLCVCVWAWAGVTHVSTPHASESCAKERVLKCVCVCVQASLGEDASVWTMKIRAREGNVLKKYWFVLRWMDFLIPNSLWSAHTHTHTHTHTHAHTHKGRKSEKLERSLPIMTLSSCDSLWNLVSVQMWI